MRSGRLGLGASAAVAAALALVPPASAAPRVYTVVIDKMRFGPAPVGLHVGDRIVWANKDFLRHSATAADLRTFQTAHGIGASTPISPRERRGRWCCARRGP